MRMKAFLPAAAFASLAACAGQKTAGKPGGAFAPGETGGLCGAVAGVQCANEADYCAYEPGECVSVADAAGICRKKPDVCTMEYDPVCGCDGKTHSSACVAASNGVSLAYKGACKEGR